MEKAMEGEERGKYGYIKSESERYAVWIAQLFDHMSVVSFSVRQQGRKREEETWQKEEEKRRRGRSRRKRRRLKRKREKERDPSHEKIVYVPFSPW
jgi:hypothetical protein